MPRRNTCNETNLKDLKLKQDFPDTCSKYFFTDRKTSMVKTIPDELKTVLDLMIKMLNYIKSKALKTRFVKKKINEEVEYHNETLVFCTEIRWLSKSKVLIKF